MDVFDCTEEEIEQNFGTSPVWFKEIYGASAARVVEDLQARASMKHWLV